MEKTNYHGGYFSHPLPAGWTLENTFLFVAYLDEHHGSESDVPAFGYVAEGRAYCEDPEALAEAMSAVWTA